jgi:hypothetical protein
VLDRRMALPEILHLRKAAARDASPIGGCVTVDTVKRKAPEGEGVKESA